MRLMLSRRVREQRLKGFHENEPEMHAGGVLFFEWFVSVSLQYRILTQIILMSIYFKSNQRI